jgi:plastocyanin
MMNNAAASSSNQPMPRLVFLAAILLVPVATADAQPKKKLATGGVKGTVIFEGEPPERKTLRRDTDPFCQKTEKLAEDVVVTRGKLKDVLVRVKNGSAGKHAIPTAPVVIDQRECMYTPRVVGLVAGQKIQVRNSDGTFHNVHGTLRGKLLWNKAHGAKAPDLALDTGAVADDVVDIVCDVHPWMHAYAVVQDHPFFAVSGEDGTFEIKGLAPGSYELEAWHPTLGSRKLKIKIGTGAKAVVPARISYKASDQ